MKIIAFTGMPFSGKSEAVAIAKKTGIPIVRMGDMVWEEAKRRGLELTDENVGRIASEMRRTHGKDIWAQKTVDTIHSKKYFQLVIIDGIRNKEEIDFFKQSLGSDFILITVEVADNIRIKRGLSRGRSDDSGRLEDIKKRDQRELGWGLGDVLKSADITISNEGTLVDFQQKVKHVLKDLMESIN